MFPTSEMVARGIYKVFWYGTIQAFVAGCAVAISMLSGNQVIFVGVAICSTFLPPICNTGVLWAWVCHMCWQGYINNEQYQAYNISGEIWIMKPSFLPDPDYTYIWYPDMRWEAMYMSWIR